MHLIKLTCTLRALCGVILRNQCMSVFKELQTAWGQLTMAHSVIQNRNEIISYI